MKQIKEAGSAQRKGLFTAAYRKEMREALMQENRPGFRAAEKA